tara:strand:+ start:352 stop:1293 length:942 start_codon:yes stop_codon:yes gene_type:complete
MTMNKEQRKAYGEMKQKDNNEQWFTNLSNAITDNNIPWRKPWVGGTGSMPRNLVSKKAYRGGNVVQLWVAGMTQGWTDLRFATRKQLIAKGYSIEGLTNADGVNIQFFKRSNFTVEDDNGEEETRSRWLVRWYTVFCVEQCTDYVAPVVETVDVVPESEMMIHFNDYIASQDTLDLHRKGVRAYYNTRKDEIVMPPHESFITPIGEVMTAFHEAIHSTGHVNRVERPLKSVFGSPEYAYEELIAEMGQLIVTLTLGGEFKPDSVVEDNANSQAYLKSWLAACKDKDKALSQAFSSAQTAADYILKSLMDGDDE